MELLVLFFMLFLLISVFFIFRCCFFTSRCERCLVMVGAMGWVVVQLGMGFLLVLEFFVMLKCFVELEGFFWELCFVTGVFVIGRNLDV